MLQSQWLCLRSYLAVFWFSPVLLSFGTFINQILLWLYEILGACAFWSCSSDDVMAFICDNAANSGFMFIPINELVALFLTFVDGCCKSFAESTAFCFSACFGSSQYFPLPQLLAAVFVAPPYLFDSSFLSGCIFKSWILTIS